MKNSSYLMFPIRSYEPEKIYPIFLKGENTSETSSKLNENGTTRFSIPENPNVEDSSSYVQNVEFCIFARRKIRNAC